MPSRSLRSLLPALPLGLWLLACAEPRAPTPGSTEPGATSSGSAPPVSPRAAQALWRAKCGACHLPVEPGSRGREAVVATMARHRKRLSLREDQWAAVTDFLAPP